MSNANLRHRPFIDGKYVAGKGRPITVTSPWTNKAIATVSTVDANGADRAVKAARRAFDDGAWSAMVPFERGRVLNRMSELITKRHKEIAHLEALDSGKPIVGARREVAGAARVYAYYAGAMDKFFGDSIPLGGQLVDFTVREPVGVCALIVPWNFPFLAVSWKMAPALAAGCTVVVKPSSSTPLSAFVLGDIANEAGVPPGVVNIISGDAAIGASLVPHPMVDKVSFTGSTAVGASIMKAAADDIKRAVKRVGWGHVSTVTLTSEDGEDLTDELDRSLPHVEVIALLPTSQRAKIKAWRADDAPDGGAVGDQIVVAIRVGHFGNPVREREFINRFAAVLQMDPQPRRGGKFELPR